MSDTTQVSLRIPNKLLEALDGLAKKEERSRAQVIIMALASSIAQPDEEQRHADIRVSGDNAPVSELRASKGAQKRRAVRWWRN